MQTHIYLPVTFFGPCASSFRILASCHLACSLYPCAAFICLQGEHALSHSSSTQALYHCAHFCTANRNLNCVKSHELDVDMDGPHMLQLHMESGPTVCEFVIPTAFVQPDHAWRTKGSPPVVRTAHTAVTEMSATHTHTRTHPHEAPFCIGMTECFRVRRLKLSGSACTLGLSSLWSLSKFTFLVHSTPLEHRQDWLQAILQIFQTL